MDALYAHVVTMDTQDAILLVGAFVGTAAAAFVTSLLTRPRAPRRRPSGGSGPHKRKDRR